jgi:PPOX class probable F420-dependent enzyme
MRRAGLKAGTIDQPSRPAIATGRRHRYEGRDIAMSPEVTLTPAQREFLDGRHYAVVGTLNADASIQQTVVWYLLDGDQIRFSVGAGSMKATNLARQATISLTVENGPRYLTLSGLAAVEPADPDLRHRLAVRYLGPDQAAAWVARRPDAPRASVRMTIRRVYGQGI